MLHKIVKLIFLLSVGAAFLVAPPPAQATFLYTETFPTDTATFPGTDPNYSEWTVLFPTATNRFPDPTDPSTYSLTPDPGSTTSAEVTSGQMRFTDTARGSFTYASVDIPNSSRVTIEADVGTLPENNDIPFARAFTSPGVFIGNLGFDFVPNATIGGGSLFLRNTTVGTFTQGHFYRFNTDITAGFGSTFEFLVDVRKTGSTTADVDIQISSGTESFATSVSFIDVKDLDRAGLFMVNDGFPVFDNVTITAEPVVSAIPEPTSITLALLGSLGILAYRRSCFQAV